MNTAPGPVRVLLVELTAPMPSVDSLDRYDSALLLLFRQGVPVGRITVPCGIGAEQLSARIDEVTAGVEVLPPPGPDAADPPLISVVIPSVFERPDLLLGTVESMLKQDHPRFEVIVVDNRPSAAHRGLISQLESFPQVTVVEQPLRGKSAACNRGIAAARGDIVTMTDDDVEAAPGWLSAIAYAFAADPGTACVTGPLLPRELETPAQLWFERAGGIATPVYRRVAFRRRPGTFLVTASGGDTMSLYRSGHFGDGPNMSFRADVLRSIGGFDTALGTGTPALAGEDPDILVRLLFAGHTLVFDPRVFILHTHVGEYDELRGRMFGYGCGYTAMLTGLAFGDPRHVLGLAAFGLRAVGLLLRKFGGDRRQAVTTGEFPRELSRLELRGLFAGPWRYLRSRRTVHRWTRALAPHA